MHHMALHQLAAHQPQHHFQSGMSSDPTATLVCAPTKAFGQVSLGCCRAPDAPEWRPCSSTLPGDSPSEPASPLSKRVCPAAAAAPRPASRRSLLLPLEPLALPGALAGPPTPAGQASPARRSLFSSPSGHDVAGVQAWLSQQEARMHARIPATVTTAAAASPLAEAKAAASALLGATPLLLP